MAFKQEILYQSPVTIIVALSEIEIGKILLRNPVRWVNAETGEPLELGTEPTLDDELVTLVMTNKVNDLLPKFIGKRKWTHTKTGEEHEMIVMERLYPLPKNHFDKPIREQMIIDFEAKMKELHDNYFVHGDLMRPTRFWNRNDAEWIFGNILQTKDGLRLIDTGFSKCLKWKSGTEEEQRSFFRSRYYEKKEVLSFKKYYLALEDA